MLIDKKASHTVRGFTLTEAAIVLGIVGLIISAIWVAAGSVYNNYRIKTTNEQILTIAQNIRSLYAQSTYIDALVDAQALIKAGVFPNDMLAKDSGGTEVANHIWGQPGTESVNIIASPSGCTGSACNAFSISYVGVPTKVCVDLLIRNTQAAKDVGMSGANGGASASNTTTLPVTLATASTECGTAATANVHFTFKVRGS